MTKQKQAGRVHYEHLHTVTRVLLGEQTEEIYARTNKDFTFSVSSVVDSIVKTITQMLRERTCVRLRKVGCLTIVNKAERSGARNPKTGEPAVVSARTVVELRKSRSKDSPGEIGINEMTNALSVLHPNIKPDELKTIYRAFISVISRCDLGTQRIELRGLGTFYPSFLPGGKKRNPKTGEPVIVEDRFATRFRCSTVIERHLNA